MVQLKLGQSKSVSVKLGFIFRENELFVFPMLQDIWMPFVILTALSAVLSIVIYGVASKQYSGKDLFMRTLMDPFL